MASLVVYMFTMGQAIYFSRRAGWGEGGGVSKNRKKMMHKKRRRTSSYTRKHGKAWEDFVQVPPIFGICIILIFLVLFE